MKIPRMLAPVVALALVVGVAATPTVTPGEPLVVAVHRFPAGDHVRGTLSPGRIPLGPAVVSSAASVTVVIPVWAQAGQERLVLADRHGRHEAFSVVVGARVLQWPITMRVQGLR